MLCSARPLFGPRRRQEHPTLEDTERVWQGVLALGVPQRTAPAASALVAMEFPAEAASLTLACSLAELQEAAARVPTRSGSSRKVHAASKCLATLAAWGYLERIESRTAIALFDDASGSLAAAAAAQQQQQEGGGIDTTRAEQALPSGMRANTLQARAWLTLARKVGLSGALQARARSGGEAVAADKAIAWGDVETEAFDSWGAEASLEPTQFANALRALQTKGLISVERSPTVQVLVRGAVREETRDQLPDKTDARAQELLEKRNLRKEKLEALAECMRCPVDASLGENETLWRLIMRYFGELEPAPSHASGGERGGIPF